MIRLDGDGIHQKPKGRPPMTALNASRRGRGDPPKEWQRRHLQRRSGGGPKSITEEHVAPIADCGRGAPEGAPPGFMLLAGRRRPNRGPGAKWRSCNRRRANWGRRHDVGEGLQRRRAMAHRGEQPSHSGSSACASGILIIARAADSVSAHVGLGCGRGVPQPECQTIRGCEKCRRRPPCPHIDDRRVAPTAGLREARNVCLQRQDLGLLGAGGRCHVHISWTPLWLAPPRIARSPAEGPEGPSRRARHYKTGVGRELCGTLMMRSTASRSRKANSAGEGICAVYDKAGGAHNLYCVRRGVAETRAHQMRSTRECHCVMGRNQAEDPAAGPTTSVFESEGRPETPAATRPDPPSA